MDPFKGTLEDPFKGTLFGPPAQAPPALPAHHPRLTRAARQARKSTPDRLTTVDVTYRSCITLMTLNYGSYGIVLMMGNAGIVSSTVS